MALGGLRIAAVEPPTCGFSDRVEVLRQIRPVDAGGAAGESFLCGHYGLHDQAGPAEQAFGRGMVSIAEVAAIVQRNCAAGCRPHTDRKSTRLNSSHLVISYAVFCL